MTLLRGGLRPPSEPPPGMAPAKSALEIQRGPRRPPPNHPQEGMAPAKPALEQSVDSRERSVGQWATAGTVTSFSASGGRRAGPGLVLRGSLAFRGVAEDALINHIRRA